MLLQPTPRLPQVEVFRLPCFMVTMASNALVILGRQRDILSVGDGPEDGRIDCAANVWLLSSLHAYHRTVNLP